MAENSASQGIIHAIYRDGRILRISIDYADEGVVYYYLDRDGKRYTCKDHEVIEIIQDNLGNTLRYRYKYRPEEVIESAVLSALTDFVVGKSDDTNRDDTDENKDFTPLFGILNSTRIDYHPKDPSGQFIFWPETLNIESEPYVNEYGGQQTRLNVRTDLIPPLAIFEVSRILSTGANKYGENNWLRIPSHEQLNHAITHAFKVTMLTRQLSKTVNESTRREVKERIRHEAAQASCRMLFFLDRLLEEAALSEEV